jgi:GNAT superfamily N-acetyltransferase
VSPELGSRDPERIAVGITLDNLEDLPKQCRQCVFWELAPHLREEAEQYGQTDFEKEVWVSSVLLDWGSCGRIVYVGGVPAGFALYAPPSAVPRAVAFPTAPVSADAVLLTSMRVLPEFQGTGVGRMLVKHVVKDLTKRGVKAIAAPTPTV